MEKEILVSKIRNGTVIDHIPASNATKILSILGVPGKGNSRVAVIINASSKKFKSKDIIKIEGRALNEDEIRLIALVAPRATINIVKEYKVLDKKPIALPTMVVGLLKCNNDKCITNNDVEATSLFNVRSNAPIWLNCAYCNTQLSEMEVMEQVFNME